MSTTAPIVLITSAEAAVILGVSRATLSRWVATGRIDYWVRLNSGAYLFDPAIIEANKSAA